MRNTGYGRCGVKVLFACGIKFKHSISFGFTFNFGISFVTFCLKLP